MKNWKKKFFLKAEIENLKLQGFIGSHEGNSFKYPNLVKDLKKLFSYLCELEPGQFDILMDCVSPYLSLLPHSSERSFDFEIQYAIPCCCDYNVAMRLIMDLWHFYLKLLKQQCERIGIMNG